MRLPGGGDFGPRGMMRDRDRDRGPGGGGFAVPRENFGRLPKAREGGAGPGPARPFGKLERGPGLDSQPLRRPGRELGSKPDRLPKPQRDTTIDPKRWTRPGPSDLDVQRLPSPRVGRKTGFDKLKEPRLRPGREAINPKKPSRETNVEGPRNPLVKPDRETNLGNSKIPPLRPGRGSGGGDDAPSSGAGDGRPKPPLGGSRPPLPGDDVSPPPQTGGGRPGRPGGDDGRPTPPGGNWPIPPQVGDGRPYPPGNDDGRPTPQDDSRPYPPDNRPDRPRRPRFPPVIVINPFPLIPPAPTVYFEPEPIYPYYPDYPDAPPSVADLPDDRPPPGRERPRPQARNPGGAGGTPPAAFAPGAAPLPYRRDFALAEQPLFRPAEILVSIEGAQPDAIASGVAQSFNLVIEESQSFVLLENRRLYRFSIPDNRAVETVAAAVGAAPGVDLAAPNFYYYLQAGAGPASLSQQYALPKLRVPDTQDLVSGRGVTVAVIDSGVDVDHPVFQRASITVYDAVEGGIKDPDQHGTAIAGIIGGRGDMSGIATGARILAVRAFAPERLGAAPTTTSMTLARATDAAFARGARVFNMSFAGPRDPLLLSLIDTAYEKGAVFVAAAGNQGPKAPPAYPAAHDKVIAITATDELDAIYSYANRGQHVAVAAPGVDILAPVTGKAFDYLSGTSFAAAHISGIVALVMERNPRVTPEEVRQVLTEAAVDLGEKGPDADFGDGLADAYGAVILVSPPFQSSFSVSR